MTKPRSTIANNAIEKAVELTQDETAVIVAIRETSYGKVTAEMKDRRITNIRREETIKPPSQQIELLDRVGLSTTDN